jgi:hypothetical protein
MPASIGGKDTTMPDELKKLGEIHFENLPKLEQDLIASIQKKNRELRTELGGNPAPEDAYSLAAMEGLRSAHGIDGFDYNGKTIRTKYAPENFPAFGGANSNIKEVWKSYAENSATEHSGGKVPTLIEFSGSDGGRIILDYTTGQVVYTPDHYKTYLLVISGTQFKAPLGTL